MKSSPSGESDATVELLKDMFIAILLLGGTTQSNVGKIVKVSTVRVNRIGKLLSIKNAT
jgi:hypothetical protein